MLDAVLQSQWIIFSSLEIIEKFSIIFTFTFHGSVLCLDDFSESIRWIPFEFYMFITCKEMRSILKYSINTSFCC